MVNWGRGVVGLGSMIRLRSMVWLGGMVHYGRVVWLWCVVVRKGGRSMDPNDGLLVASVAVDGLRRSCGLAVDQRVDGAMGFVDRHVHRGRVALQRFQIKRALAKILKIMIKEIIIIIEEIRRLPFKDPLRLPCNFPTPQQIFSSDFQTLPS